MSVLYPKFVDVSQIYSCFAFWFMFLQLISRNKHVNRKYIQYVYMHTNLYSNIISFCKFLTVSFLIFHGMLLCTIQYTLCIAGKENQSQNNCIDLVNPVMHYGGLAGRWEPSWDHLKVLHWPSISSPPHLSADIGESYKYWVLRKNSLVLSVAVTKFCDALVLTSSSSSASPSTSPFFNILWDRVSWLFFRLSLCLFLGRS